MVCNFDFLSLFFW